MPLRLRGLSVDSATRKAREIVLFINIISGERLPIPNNILDENCRNSLGSRFIEAYRNREKHQIKSSLEDVERASSLHLNLIYRSGPHVKKASATVNVLSSISHQFKLFSPTRFTCAVFINSQSELFSPCLPLWLFVLAQIALHFIFSLFACALATATFMGKRPI